MDERTLKACFSQIRAGDKHAFSQVYEEMKQPVYAVAYRILCKKEAAEDVVQDVFVKLFVSPPDPSVSSVRAWIIRMARNRAIDVLRQKNPVSLDESEPFREDEVNKLVTRIDLERAIAALSCEQREIIALHLHADLTFHQIAQITGLSLPAAYRKYQKALHALRSFLNGGST